MPEPADRIAAARNALAEHLGRPLTDEEQEAVTWGWHACERYMTRARGRIPDQWGQYEPPHKRPSLVRTYSGRLPPPPGP